MSSPVTPIVPPDVELLVIDFLGQFLTVGQTISSEYPTGYGGKQTFVIVNRIGGQMSSALPWFDRVSLDVSCCGPNKSMAQDLQQYLRPRLLTMWSYSFPSGVVTDVVEEAGPIWLADPDYSKAGRYLLQVAVTVHP